MDTRLGDSITVTVPPTSCCFLRLFPMYLFMGIYRDIYPCVPMKGVSVFVEQWAVLTTVHFYLVFSWPLSFGWITAFQNTTHLLINVTSIAGPLMSDLKLRDTKTRVGQMSPATQQILMALDNWHANVYHVLTDLPHLWTLPALFLCFFG